MITKIQEPIVSYTAFNIVPIRGDVDILSMQFDYQFTHTGKDFEFTIQSDFVAYAGRKGEVLLQGCTCKFVCETDGKLTPVDLYKLQVTAMRYLKNHLQTTGEMNPIFAKKLYPPSTSLVNSQLQRFVDVFLRDPDEFMF